MRKLIVPVLLMVALPVFAATPLTFEEADTDGDGLVSADEAANVQGLDFDAADADADGTLSVDEYDIAVESLPPTTESNAPKEMEVEEITIPDSSSEPSLPPPATSDTPATPVPSTTPTPSATAP